MYKNSWLSGCLCLLFFSLFVRVLLVRSLFPEACVVSVSVWGVSTHSDSLTGRSLLCFAWSWEHSRASFSFLRKNSRCCAFLPAVICSLVIITGDQSHCSGVISKLHCIPNPCRAVLRTRVHEFLVPVLTCDGLWVVDSPRVLSLCPSLWVIIVLKMQLKWTKSSAPQVNTVKAHDVTAAKTDWSCISVKTSEDMFMILWLDCFVYHHSTMVFCESCQNQFLWR